METVLVRAPESIVFGLKSPEKPCKSRKKSVQISLGARCCRFESCHFDQNEKKRAHPSSCCFHKIIRRRTSANACICLFCAPISFDLVSFRRKTMVLSPVTSTKIAYLPPKNRSNKCKVNIFSPVAVYRNARLGVELARFRFFSVAGYFYFKIKSSTKLKMNRG